MAARRLASFIYLYLCMYITISSRSCKYIYKGIFAHATRKGILSSLHKSINVLCPCYEHYIREYNTSRVVECLPIILHTHVKLQQH